MGLSRRGAEASNTILRVDMNVYFEAMNNLYHPYLNPEGTFPMNVAENKLNWGMLQAKIQQISKTEPIPDWVAGYTSGKGAPTFRQAVANFLAAFLTHCPIDPEQLLCSAGSTSVIELTSYMLADAGEVVVIPAPAYPVYKQDVGNISKLERYDLQTHTDISELNPIIPLTVEHLDQAWQQLTKAGKQWRLLILTAPDNPTGGIYSATQLSAIADWCIAHQIHLIVNEIYGLSLIDTQHPAIRQDYAAKIEYRSFAQIMQAKQSDYLHLWYAFSKDFGISGFRMGVLYTLNEALIKAYENFNYPRLISNHSQWLLQRVLEDKAFVNSYIAVNQRLLTANYVLVAQTLQSLKIKYAPARGSLFVWMDLSAYLADHTQAAEDEFWLQFYHSTGILLTPGQGFENARKGCYRLVYSYFPKPILAVAMNRMKTFLATF